jgi:hypothetical protein
MAAGLVDELMDKGDIVRPTDEYESRQKGRAKP